MSIERIGLLDEVTAVERELLFTSHDELPHYESVHGTIKGDIDMDILMMEDILSTGVESDFLKAYGVYEFGANSRPYAMLSFDRGLPVDVNEGVSIKGNTITNKPVEGLVLQNAKHGSQTLKVEYIGSPSCVVGGNPNPQTEGCFASSGQIAIQGYAVPLHYEYNETAANLNYHALQRFSTLAESKMKLCKNCAYITEFGTFVDYFEVTTYADDWIRAAFAGRETSFPRNGNVDFTGFSPKARTEVIKVASAHLSTLMLVFRDMEEAALFCQEDCGPKRCIDKALRLLDSAVAYYAGSLVRGKDSGNGRLLHTLADEMCQSFKTCGTEGNKLTGASKVNYDVYSTFLTMQEGIKSNKCTSTRKGKAEVSRRVFVPLIQATLRSAYMREANPGTDETAQLYEAVSITYAATLLPMLSFCSVEDAGIVYENLKIGAPTSFAEVKAALERRYSCFQVTCEDIGGLYNRKTGSYYKGAQPCVTPKSGKDALEKAETHIPWVLVVLLLGGAFVYYKLRRKWSDRQERLRKYDADNDLSDSDDEDHALT